MRRIGPTLAVCALIVWYTPVWPVLPYAQLDSGWALALSVACERGLVFGRDLLFTYGPLGCYGTRQYWPTTYWGGLVLFASVAGLAALLTYDAHKSARDRFAALIALAWLGIEQDTALFALPLSYANHAYAKGTRSWRTVATLAVMAALTLVKFTLLPLMSLTVIASCLMRREKSIAGGLFDGALFVVTMAGAWWLAGQPFEAIPDYLSGSAEVSRGYAQAMSWPGGASGSSTRAQIIAACVVFASLGAGWLAIDRSIDGGDERLSRFGWGLFVVVLMLLGIRLGTTRGDPEHLVRTAILAGAVVLHFWPQDQRLRRWARGIVLTCAALTLALGLPRDPAQRTRGMLARHFDGTIFGQETWRSGLLPQTTLEARLALERQVLGQQPLLNAIDDRFDIIGEDQYLLLALDTRRWAPRPIVQGYSAYTDRLTRLDAAYLAGTRAPTWLVVAVRPIDGRFAMMDDPAIWPVLKSRYDSLDTDNTHALLKLRRTPRPFDAPLVQSELNLSDWTPMPSFGSSDVYARLVVRESISDRLLALAWKPAINYLEVRTSSPDQTKRYRMVPEAAASGFLLSPLIENHRELDAWMRDEPQRSAHVTAVRIIDGSGRPIASHLTLSTRPFWTP